MSLSESRLEVDVTFGLRKGEGGRLLISGAMIFVPIDEARWSHHATLQQGVNATSARPTSADNGDCRFRTQSTLLGV